MPPFSMFYAGFDFVVVFVYPSHHQHGGFNRTTRTRPKLDIVGGARKQSFFSGKPGMIFSHGRSLAGL